MKLTTISFHFGFKNDEYLLDCIVILSFNSIAHFHDFEAIHRLFNMILLSFQSVDLALS